MTPDEYQQRRGRLGATDFSSILGVNPYRTEYETWLEKTGRIEPDKGTKSTDAGNRCEPVVLDYAEEDLGAKLERNVVCWAPDGLPIASTLDARIPNSSPVEGKTSGLAGPVYGHWGPPDSDEIPDVYLVQVTIQMFCTGSDLAYLYALLGGRGFVRYQVRRDEEIMRRIVDTGLDWWERHVVKGIEPERTEPVPLDVVKRMRRTPKKTVEFDERATTIVDNWEAAVAARKRAVTTEKEWEAAMILRLGDAEGAYLTDGRMLTYLEQTRRPYAVLHESTYRVARIKERPNE